MDWIFLILISLWIGFCCFGIVNPLRFGLGKGENTIAIIKSLLFTVLLLGTLACRELYLLDLLCYLIAGIIGVILGCILKPEDDTIPPDGWNPPTWPPQDTD